MSPGSSINLQQAPPTRTDTLGCPSDKLHLSQEFAGAGLRLYRKRSADPALAHVAMPAADRGVLVGLSLGTDHRRRILHPHHASLHDFGRGTVYVRNFCDDYRADLSGPMDFLLLELSRDLLGRIVDEEGTGRLGGLSPVAGVEDPVLSHLLHALMPALERPEAVSRLFVDHLAMAAGLHLLGRYGGAKLANASVRAKGGGLSRAHATRAKEMLRARLDGDVSVADVAEACGLSRSHFIRAFRQSTGQTPHQWLQACRIECARDLLSGSSQSLAEVASACGFADQSHFTRVFAQQVGVPPGQWRRHAPVAGSASRIRN
ncbi:hypothetical protein RD110_09575 [Rhodoferax koreense]|uniref:HTH araC/xylS-type domain-containing protein n=1 Tax=Rhodoferax koreensis TaxID=1842727 RepID=A0A1P8JUH5_9BURK|nr:AraC family transcriptional regulator [Rhodoferax koreense]APW37407.1 hypothetical protein RD110_09575 [Rhodoferax koreense]